MFDECKKENKQCKNCEYTCKFVVDSNDNVIFAYMWGPLYITPNLSKEIKNV